MHNEGTGREVQAAGSAGGSDAEGAEVPPAAEGGLTPDTNAHAPRPHRHTAPGKWERVLFHVYSAFINTPETVILPCFAPHLNYD